jgi:hypothetical protein
MPGQPQLLEPEEVNAAKAGWQWVKEKTATEVSDESHEKSRAWRSAAEECEMDIFLDAMGEAEYLRLKSRVSEGREAIRDAAAAVDGATTTC